ncbi:hypothetical protein PAEPH01_0718 [Pancytospora epiphaga]|nr:hypothetical protein PAEPH01_0718 [Pancytospora epiphaga]
MENREVDRNNVITRANLGVVSTTAEEMDEKRRNTVVLDYLRKLDEAKDWIEQHINKEIDLSTFITEMPKGEWLAEISKSFDPKIKERIYLADTKEYLHTDNINLFLSWLKKIGLSKHFYFEVIDLYESKNIPKVIYCIHGLAHYMNLKGMSNGIKRSKSVFTDADKKLVGEDILNIEEHCYDDIEEKVMEIKDDQSNSSVSAVISSEIPGQFIADLSEESKIIKSFSKTYLWNVSFKNLCNQEKITIPLLRKFLKFDSKVNAEEQKLLEVNKQIFSKFKENFSMQEEKDGILRSARLLLENQCRLRQIEFNEVPLANDYRLFKRVVYNLLHDYDLLYKMLEDGYELPLRVFYPDNRIGDYHFSKFIEHVREKNGDDARRIAGSHFRSSRVFAQTMRIFSNGEGDKAGHANNQFNLNPLDISNELYGDKTEKNLLSRKSLLDEAIKDKKVRIEIVKRVDNIIRFVNDRVDYFRKVSLPVYVGMFVTHKTFFEDFLEPAIMLSDNFIISEIVKYIFYNKKLFDGQTYFFEQERLTYYNCKVERTSNFDLADYSPLKDWLESDAYAGFYAEFIRNNELEGTVNELMLKEEGEECVEIEVSLEEVNNIIIVLKENTNVMNNVMSSMVTKMTLLKQQPVNVLKASVRCNTEECYDRVDVLVNSEVVGGESTCDHLHDSENKYMDVEGSSFSGSNVITLGAVGDIKDEGKEIVGKKHKCTHVPKISYFEEKFVLKLDTQFIDLDNDTDFAISSVLNNLKSRIILLITISNENSLYYILNVTPESEIERFSVLNYYVDSLIELKKSVLDDLEFLAAKRIISSENGYQSVLEMIAYDFIRLGSGTSEYSLNCDTLDALFKKGVLLRQQLDSLYAYSSALFASMVTNKSGKIFNRQCVPHSAYGSYKYSMSVLEPRAFEDLDVANVHFVISMEEPLVFSIAVWHGGKVWDTFKDIRFDELLRLQEDRTFYFNANNFMALSVSKLIDIVNEQYIHY